MASPCVAVCRIDPQFGYCAGCGRTRREITQWPGSSLAQQALIRAELPARMRRMKPSLIDMLRKLVHRDHAA